MRRAFVDGLVKRGLENPNVMLVTGDLGFSVVEPFREVLPKQFINAGVAEQAMASMCAGLASVGRHVFMYSIVNFATFRCLEQLRNDISYHGYSVCVVAVGAGTSYGTLGYSHHGLEDIAVVRALPNMQILSPADASEMDLCLGRILQTGGPSYLRLGHAPHGQIHAGAIDGIGGCLEIQPGVDVSLLATGSVVEIAIQAAGVLSQERISAQVISIPVVAPLNPEELASLVGDRPVVTVEDHSVSGGLGTCVLEALNDAKASRPVLRIGYPPGGLETYGSQSFLREAAGLTSPNICNQVRDVVRRTSD